MVDRSRCSFPIPDFASDGDERARSASLTVDQRWELFRLLQIARRGESAVDAPMDRAAFQVLSKPEFRAIKDADEEWRRANGWPPVIPVANMARHNERVSELQKR